MIIMILIIITATSVIKIFDRNQNDDNIDNNNNNYIEIDNNIDNNIKKNINYITNNDDNNERNYVFIKFNPYLMLFCYSISFRTRADMYKSITPDYYGYRDEDDGILVQKEIVQEVRHYKK